MEEAWVPVFCIVCSETEELEDDGFGCCDGCCWIGCASAAGKCPFEAGTVSGIVGNGCDKRRISAVLVDEYLESFIEEEAAAAAEEEGDDTDGAKMEPRLLVRLTAKEGLLARIDAITLLPCFES